MTRLIFLLTMVVGTFVAATPGRAEAIAEGRVKIQVAYDVDVVVAGGSSHAVAAAVNAAKSGASVFLVTDRPYLGEDLCMRVDYHLPIARQTDPLLKALWQGKPDTSPLVIKRTLDRALLDNQIPFLTGSYPVEIVTDESGRFAGITMVNRSGRHCVRAKVLIDATDQSILARQSGIPFTEVKAKPIDFSFRVVGGEAAKNEKISVTPLDFTVPTLKGKGRYKVTEYRFARTVKTGNWSEIAKVEQELRTLCRQRGMVECAERMSYHLDIRMKHRQPLADWPGADKVDLKQFYSPDVPEIIVLGKYASLNKECAAIAIDRPDHAVPLGRRLGRLAAEHAKKFEPAELTKILNVGAGETAHGEVRYWSRPLRTSPKQQYVTLAGQSLPVLGKYEVVVVGGGTSGAPAALAATEMGAKTLVVEYLDELGGVGTAGMIAKYWYGLRHGFTQRIDKAIGATDKGWNIIDKSEWLRTAIQRAGGDVWLRSYGCGAVVDNGQVRGIVVVTPQGRGIVLAKVVIDATGNSDIPTHAGAETSYSIDKNGIFSVQLAGYPHRSPGENQRNTCYALVDDTDAIDIWHLMLTRRHEKSNHFDVGQHVDSRERRRIVGDYTLTTQDILAERTFPDTLLQMRSNFDASNFPSSPMLLVKDMKGPVYTCNVPYRCFLPKGLEGIYAIGLGASAHRDAMTLVRMQPDLQNQGYAIGMAAAMAAMQEGKTRDVDMKALQRAVIEQGVLSQQSYGAVDSFPLLASEIRSAVTEVATMSRELAQKRDRKHAFGYASLAELMAHPKLAIPALKGAMAQASKPTEKINCACVLAAMGNDSGAKILIQAVSKAKWTGGYSLTSHRETHNTFSDVDRMVIAIGQCDSDDARATLLQKLTELEPSHPLSDFIAISLAFREKEGEDLVRPLRDLLTAFRSANYLQTYSLEKSMTSRKTTSKEEGRELNGAIKQLIVAGLLYNSGDDKGLGEQTLQAYRNELSGHLSRYAEYLLAQPERSDYDR